MELLHTLDRSPAADMFSLGITLFEACSLGYRGGVGLPGEGPEWHHLRSGAVEMPFIEDSDLRALIANLIDPNISARYSAEQVVDLEKVILNRDNSSAIQDYISRRNASRSLRHVPSGFRHDLMVACGDLDLDLDLEGLCMDDTLLTPCYGNEMNAWK